jgi:hypothetical protein
VPKVRQGDSSSGWQERRHLRCLPFGVLCRSDQEQRRRADHVKVRTCSPPLKPLTSAATTFGSVARNCSLIHVASATPHRAILCRPVQEHHRLSLTHYLETNSHASTLDEPRSLF